MLICGGSVAKCQEDKVVILIGAAAQYWLPAKNVDSSSTATANQENPFIAAIPIKHCMAKCTYSHTPRLLAQTTKLVEKQPC